MKLKYRKGIFCVVYRKEKGKILYLLLKRKLHWKGWEFPKGGRERGESEIKAVKREIREETGEKAEKIKKYRLSGKYDYNKIFPDRQGIKGQTWKLFSCEIKGKKIKLDKLEHSGYKWLEYSKALKMLTFDSQKKCLKDVEKKLK